MEETTMKKSGFTLIELMIVVAIIAIIAAIALPSLLSNRVTANEGKAIANMRTVSGAQASYHAAQTKYSATFAALCAATPPYLQSNWNADPAVVGGYTYTMASPDAFSYTCGAASGNVKVGNRGFFVDDSGVIRHKTGTAAATVTDNSIDQPPS
jgi:prepilin-type N-terminal cleavage/methylation domain-containing protein